MRRRVAMAAVLATLAVGLAWRMAAEAPGVVSPAAAAALSPELLRGLQDGRDTPQAGNPMGAVTIVEFFDYRCPYCRIMQPRLEALAAKDKRVRILFKDWPIFGGVSVSAARVALAAQFQGKYLAVQKALFALPRTMDEAALRDAVAGAGVDMARLDRDLAVRSAVIDAELARTDGEARAIGFQGTPGLVLGAMAMPGALTDVELQKLVNQAAAQ